MSFVGKALRKGLGGIVGMLLAPKPKTSAPLPQVSRDTLAEDEMMDERLRMRRGTAADILTGTRGAEAAAGTVGKLIAGN